MSVRIRRSQENIWVCRYISDRVEAIRQIICVCVKVYVHKCIRAQKYVWVCRHVSNSAYTCVHKGTYWVILTIACVPIYVNTYIYSIHLLKIHYTLNLTQTKIPSPYFNFPLHHHNISKRTIGQWSSLGGRAVAPKPPPRTPMHTHETHFQHTHTT